MNFLYIFKFLLSFSNFTLYFTKGAKYRWLLPFKSNINRKGLKIKIPASHFLRTVHASFGRLCCCVFCQVPTRAEPKFLLMLNILFTKCTLNIFAQQKCKQKYIFTPNTFTFLHEIYFRNLLHHACKYFAEHFACKM